jgi:hypothetical protein
MHCLLVAETDDCTSTNTLSIFALPYIVDNCSRIKYIRSRREVSTIWFQWNDCECSRFFSIWFSFFPAVGGIVILEGDRYFLAVALFGIILKLVHDVSTVIDKQHRHVERVKHRQ